MCGRFQSVGGLCDLARRARSFGVRQRTISCTLQRRCRRLERIAPEFGSLGRRQMTARVVVEYDAALMESVQLFKVAFHADDRLSA